MICKDSTKSENNSPLNYGQCQEEAREYEQSDKLGETVGGDPSPDTIEKGCGRFPNCLHSSIDECLQNKQGVNQDVSAPKEDKK